jgi:hypothetical protein
MNEPSKIKSKIAFYVIVSFILVITLGLFFVSYFPLYGFSYPPCGEREQASAIPAELQNKTITFIKSVAYHNENSIYCGKEMQKTSTIVTDKDAYSSQTSITGAETFMVQEAFLHRNYGLNGLDAGTEWVKYFILKDSKGKLSRVSCVALNDYLKLKINCNK